MKRCGFGAASSFSSVACVAGPARRRRPASRRRRRARGSVAALPKEARETLALIKRGGPFPYKQDGATFGNFEKRLPMRARGYYHEYTVPTPGARDRGARRIVAGGGEYYYTDDHYRSFRRIRE